MRMKTVWIIFILTMISASLFSQNYINESRWVTAGHGLKIRENPDLNSKTLDVIPNKEEVLLLEEKPEEITISGTVGKWSLVQYGKLKGWVFGGFLSIENPGVGSEVSEADIIGYWEYSEYFGHGLTFSKGKVTEEEPMGGVGTWKLKDNTIIINIDSEMHDPGGGSHRIGGVEFAVGGQGPDGNRLIARHHEALRLGQFQA